MAQRYGVLRPEGKSERAIFVIDRTGIIRYVDVHPIEDQPDNEVLFKELAAIEGVEVPQEILPDSSPPPTVVPAQSAAAVDLSAPRVTMYCTDWCPACRRARAYLKINNISFQEINIARDRLAAAKVRELTGGAETTPTFDVGGSVVVNFDVDKLNRLLGIDG